MIDLSRPAMIAMARQAAMNYDVDGDLICAIVEQESNWNPWAIRFEQEFFRRYIAPKFTQGEFTITEAYSRSFSWGLMQVMGQVAREEGFPPQKPLSELCDPLEGLDAGSKHFAAIAHRVGAVPDAHSVALLHYNGGADPNYPGQVLARLPAYSS